MGKRIAIIVGLAFVTAFAWLAAPIYQFYAHRGLAPLPPWSWETISDPVPREQTAFDPSYEGAGTRALQALADYRAANKLPALSAAVARTDGLIWVGAVGFSDIASGTPATPATLFRIGSTSKALTGTALARLVERAEIDLDTPLSAYPMELANPAWSAITARQLASHMAGTPHYGENGDLVGLYSSIAMDLHYDDVRQALAVFDDSPLLFEPGTAFHYSSLGTVLLGAAMSEVAGISYRELLQREVLDPAGMRSTYADSDKDPRADRLTTLYYTDGERFRPWRKVDLSHRLPGGGYISSPADLAQLGAKYFDASYLGEETRALFWTPQRLADGSVNEQDYALGWRWREWEIEGVGLARNANHGGVSRGSQCWLLVYPDFELSMAFCTNTKTAEFGTFGGFYEELLRSFASARRPKARETQESSSPTSAVASLARSST